MRRFSKLIPLGLLIAVLAILIPAILHSREAARRSQSKNNLKQFCLAFQNYNDVFSTLPPGGTFDSNGNAHHSWSTFLDPFLSSDPWYTFVNGTPLSISICRGMTPRMSAYSSWEATPLKACRTPAFLHNSLRMVFA
ncbi:DUF1559 family PulG-like putative transporter [Schlesneria paludicola]|uniref:DUF1559 family PulG-like putative transporter n=1 Tax=Schlesneria paludicola TaxID=360056 RepID=UPI000A070D60|nr:DUF1559 domain-containing protein [Schlesneria paludicola]